ncbi:2-oxoglutarate dehydrogenase E1 component [Texcoconibacillus texcoconensis]|uniref:2-oxoglutarate dehydrogenase E1 component n=1 Tax=Texcoconibacillus texcoconensis TaxID=1095777 RepID=A0A840QQF7_9BACI|nr:2-oxoglutarate dehydrogenase E1 component [Texcoconibacillus texcoconensis]MBB5173666.1 2-oxoglutarate dehydrogenase E1 component [Texcoconibacillus texcoconensis]
MENAEHPSSQFFHGPNVGYLLEMYERYENDRESVPKDLQQYFDQYGAPDEGRSHFGTTQRSNETNLFTLADILKKAIKLVDDIRIYGHQHAQLSYVKEREESIDFSLQNYGLSKSDLEQLPAYYLCESAPSHVKNGWEAIEHLKKVYIGTIAFELHHVNDTEEKQWLYQQVESEQFKRSLSEEEQRDLLGRLTKVEGFENFLHKTFVGQKRFSVEGLDALVPMLDEVVKRSVEDGTTNIFIGMAHRGRLNVLAHVLGKPYELILSEFHDAPNKELVPSEGSIGINYGWTGDVKYHLGADREIKESAKTATITLANNPSHLEYVNPVVNGFARAAQEDRSSAGTPERNPSSSFPIMVHGDASFPGQGVVSETLNLGQLQGYSVGGTIHVIANNQIGFTTVSQDSRSTMYSSDLAKGFEMPIIHVNADDPEACLSAIDFAYRYRKAFKKDVLIDLIGYRRFGHNEMDEPAATQPKLYQNIRNHPTVCELYGRQLQERNVVQESELESWKSDIQDRLTTQVEKVKQKKRSTKENPEPPAPVSEPLNTIDTGVAYNTLQEMNRDLLQWPENFTVFPKLEKILKRREDALGDEGKVDWAHGETLAFATILNDGTPIRLTGQDSQRGTFSQRHLVLHDPNTSKTFSPLHTISQARASFAIHNSPLSEAAVVGFEYGYNVQAPETLTIWEAQYGDFSNAAQVMFDQFIAAGRAKWDQKSGLVLLLPHGYEGQGPEHSSGRIERFLQLAAENNWHVANATSAAQYFHLLRRQASLLEKPEVRPLVVMTPKSLLRHRLTTSQAQEFTQGHFQPIVEEERTIAHKQEASRLVLCSGKVAIDAAEHIEQMDDQKRKDVHIVRVEELYPFPESLLKEVVNEMKNLSEIVWLQEEPNNMGAWNYIYPQLKSLTPNRCSLQYVGRKRRSSPAEGDPNVHKKEQQRIISEALNDEEGREM